MKAVRDHSAKPQPSIRAIARAVDRAFAKQERRQAEVQTQVAMLRALKTLVPRSQRVRR